MLRAGGIAGRSQCNRRIETPSLAGNAISGNGEPNRRPSRFPTAENLPPQPAVHRRTGEQGAKAVAIMLMVDARPAALRPRQSEPAVVLGAGDVVVCGRRRG